MRRLQCTTTPDGWFLLPGAAAGKLVGMGDFTRVLDAAAAGDPHAAADLLPLVYDELRALAARRLAHEKPGQTLQATALVHEAYLRLVGASGDASAPRGQHWSGRGHFFAAAAEAMRRILVEAARRKARKKRGGEHHQIELADSPAPDPDDELLALNDALNRLEQEDPVAAKVVELHQFAGLGHEETATALGITVYLARQKWAYARDWLRDAVGR